MTWKRHRGLASRLLGLVCATLAIAVALPGCGGDDTEAFGVAIDESSPEGAAIAYVGLIDTCDPEAARRAFQLLLQPEGFEREAIEASADYDETLAQASERFMGQGFCEDPNQVRVAEIVTRLYDAHPEDGAPLPTDTVLVSLDAGTTTCEGSPSEALAVMKVDGVWKVDADQTGVLGGDDSLLRRGCVFRSE